ncbi:MAG: hypothetical protein JO234_10365 [Hyphomicrobiales bacterium]|nr:hypothetical protein [Hyphomicrobiales bacterium]
MDQPNIERLPTESTIVPVGVSFQRVKAPPPNLAAIHKAFPGVIGRTGIVFAYWDVVYDPDDAGLTAPIMAHEMTHLQRQRRHGSAAAWWDIYLADPEFRLGEEIVACRAELEVFSNGPPLRNRKQRAAYRDAIAERLSSRVYGYMIRKKDALAALKVEADYG